MTIEEKRWTEKDIDNVLGLLDEDPDVFTTDAASIIRQQRAELAELRKKQKEWATEDKEYASQLDATRHAIMNEVPNSRWPWLETIIIELMKRSHHELEAAETAKEGEKNG